MGNVELTCEIIWTNDEIFMDTGNNFKDATMMKIGQAIYYFATHGVDCLTLNRKQF